MSNDSNRPFAPAKALPHRTRWFECRAGVLSQPKRSRRNRLVAKRGELSRSGAARAEESTE